MIFVECKNCGKHLKAEDKYIGKKTNCPKCKAQITIQIASDNSQLSKSEKNDKIVTSKTVIFICTHCNKEFETLGNLIGKDMVCPFCSYTNNTKTNNDNTPPTKLNKAIAINYEQKIIIVLVSIITLVISALLIWVFIFRDTWELDNGYKLKKMCQSVIEMMKNGNSKEGIDNYEKVSALIGDRQIEDIELRNAIQQAQNIAEPVIKKISETKNLERIHFLVKKANDLVLNDDLIKAVEIYREAVVIIKKLDQEDPVVKEVLKGVESRLQFLLGELSRRQSALVKKQEEEDYNKQMKLKGYVKFRGKWLSPEDYNKAKSTFPANEVHEGFEACLLEKEGYVLKLIQIKESDDLEFPYSIEITIISFKRIPSSLQTTQLTYTFGVDENLNLSDSCTYEKVDGSYLFKDKEIKDLSLCLRITINKIKSSWQ